MPILGMESDAHHNIQDLLTSSLEDQIPKSRLEEHPLTTVAGKLYPNSIDTAKMARLALASTFLLLLVPASAADASQHVMSAHSRSSGGTMSDVRDEHV